MNSTTLLILIVGAALLIGCIAAGYFAMKWAQQSESFHQPGAATSEDDREVSGNSRSHAAMTKSHNAQNRKSA